MLYMFTFDSDFHFLKLVSIKSVHVLFHCTAEKYLTFCEGINTTGTPVHVQVTAIEQL